MRGSEQMTDSIDNQGVCSSEILTGLLFSHVRLELTTRDGQSSEVWVRRFFSLKRAQDWVDQMADAWFEQEWEAVTVPGSF